MNLSELTARIQWLTDVEAIKQLKHTYCAHCDRNYDPDALASLFVEDAVWDGGKMGELRGRPAIRQYFADASGVVPFAVHIVANPIITVDGDRATGRWYLWQPMVFQIGAAREAYWLSAIYDDQYERYGDGWLFKHVRVTTRMLVPYEAGFSEALIPDVYPGAASDG